MSEKEKEKEYGYQQQELFLSFLISDKDLAARCQSIIDADYFDRRLRSTAEFIKSYITTYGNIPTTIQIKAMCGIDVPNLGPAVSAHAAWFLEEFEGFARHKALEKAILKSADFLEKSQYGAVEKLIKDAIQIGLPKSFGTNYFADPKGRLNALRANNGQVSTGWKIVDNKLYGGFNRGELNIFCAASGGGKSIFLQNLALNWALSGMNVVYFSLELNEGLSSKRIDSMLTGVHTTDIYKDLDNVDLKVRMAGKGAGVFQIVQLPTMVTANDLLVWIKEFQTQNNIKIDAILVDYLDLMMPGGQKISASDLYIKDKLVSEELRNLAVNENILLATASQLNRSAVDSVEFDHSMIAGGLSKIQTADNVLGIYGTETMRSRGLIQIQFLKTRSSGGVGHRVDLAFDQSTLRITDPSEQSSNISTPSKDLFNKLKRNNVGTSIDMSTGEILDTKKPSFTSSIGNANRDALRAIVSREV